MSTTLDNIPKSTVGEIQVLLSRYVDQLVNGCGDIRCIEIHCHTGSTNTAARQPRRRLTPRAARAIALTICDRQKPRSHLCPYYDRAISVESDAERDASSIVQQLVDTPTIKRLYGHTDPALEPRSEEFKELQCMHQQLRPLHAASAHLPGAAFVNNIVLSNILGICLEWILSRGGHLHRLAPWYWVDAEAISPGNAYPQVPGNTPTDGSYNTWLAILDVLDHKPYSRLLESVCKIVANRCRLEHALAMANPNRPRDARRSICALLASRVGPESRSPERAVALVIWLKKLFAQQWNTEPVVKNDTCYGLLEFMQALQSRMATFSYTRMEIFVMRFITSRLSVCDISQSWASPSEGNAVHLLHYRFLFSTDQLYLVFRTINHLTMSQAHRLVIQARKIREKAKVRGNNLSEQQHHAEVNCLLLSVSREYMLKDTFDQLWHRRKGELRRPLRVRLGTIAELQVGQDLGGVQVEFFNLLCRGFLDEQVDMFTTEPKTGYSYLKAGSSQSLAYFRYFGVLLALAMYNGITLPITLPEVFYHFLKEGTPPDGSDIGVLDDGWPELAKSLRRLTDEDIQDLDFTFDLNAHGTHISVLSPRRDQMGDLDESAYHSLSTPSALKVVNHYPNKFALEDINLPGWKFEEAVVEPEEVTPLNKSRYIREKIYWHTYVSVAPQLSAVLDGFKSADLFPYDTLKYLFTAITLKSYTEGTDQLDINELRAAASYTDYDAGEEYIQSFWRVVSDWPEDKQKQLLKFVTAAERIPISGPSQLVFTIKRADNAEHLPTSHTCFGTLDLPRYESKEILDKKLSLALRYGSEGFGVG